MTEPINPATLPNGLKAGDYAFLIPHGFNVNASLAINGKLVKIKSIGDDQNQTVTYIDVNTEGEAKDVGIWFMTLEKASSELENLKTRADQKLQEVLQVSGLRNQASKAAAPDVFAKEKSDPWDGCYFLINEDWLHWFTNPAPRRVSISVLVSEGDEYPLSVVGFSDLPEERLSRDEESDILEYFRDKRELISSPEDFGFSLHEDFGFSLHEDFGLQKYYYHELPQPWSTLFVDISEEA